LLEINKQNNNEVVTRRQEARCLGKRNQESCGQEPVIKDRTKNGGKKSKNCSTGAFGKGIGTRSERAHEPGVKGHMNLEP
jgi:hypothetical protein